MRTSASVAFNDEVVEDQFMDDAWGNENEHEVSLEEGHGQDTPFPAKRKRVGAPETDLDTVKLYLQDIRKTPLLTFVEEQALAKRVQEGEQEARSKMIQSNLRLVVSIGKRYINRGLPFSDIIESSHAPGGLGVFEATMLDAVGVPSDQLLASLLLFRGIYYLVPFILAMALLGAYEAVRRWRSLREAMAASGPEDEE